MKEWIWLISLISIIVSALGVLGAAIGALWSARTTYKNVLAQIIIQITNTYSSNEMLSGMLKLREFQQKHGPGFAKIFKEIMDRDYAKIKHINEIRRKYSHYFRQIWLMIDTKTVKIRFIKKLIPSSQVDFLLEIIEPLEKKLGSNYNRLMFDTFRKIYCKNRNYSNYEIEGISFKYVCEVIPELVENKKPKEFRPHLNYRNRLNKSLHEYGMGPFCRFKIPKQWKRKQGVYIIYVDRTAKYVGECEDLVKRFNSGYGNISPRNCYKGGQLTNCRINSFILDAFKKGLKIELFFHETVDRFNIENMLIIKFKPEWNKTAAKSLSGDNSFHSRSNRFIAHAKADKQAFKYQNLENYLWNSKKRIETLSFEEIEKILGFKLPYSAYGHRAWWANGGHTHADAWLNPSWKVSSVTLGKFVTFEKIKKE